MNCLNCEWNLELDQSEHKSLSKLIKLEKNSLNENIFFDEIKNYYLNLGNDLEKKNLETNLLLNFEEFKNINHLKDSSIDSFLQNLLIKKEIINQSIDFPIQTKLRSKSSKRCKACRTSLMKPELDSFSTKFYKLSNAIDFLPSIEIKNYPMDLNINNNQFLLVFKNPLNIPMNIKISSHLNKLNLPVSKFKIDKKAENSSKLENFIKQLPYIELTKNTRISRTELMNRKPPIFENFENILEQNFNYIVIPIKFDENETGLIKTYLFVSVQTELFNTGFWCVLELNI